MRLRVGRICRWMDWQATCKHVRVNKDKYWVLYLSHNLMKWYRPWEEWLINCLPEKDARMLVDSWTWTGQMVKKTNGSLARTRNSVSNKARAVVNLLFSVLGRLHLEYRGKFWASCFKEDMELSACGEEQWSCQRIRKELWGESDQIGRWSWSDWWLDLILKMFSNLGDSLFLIYMK